MQRPIALFLTLGLLAGPAAAQQTDLAPGVDGSDIEDGVDMLSEGARRVLRGLMGEVEPRMRDLADALKEWDFEGIGIDDLGRYHPPEVLPNGDIILRRKQPRDTPPRDPSGDRPDHPMDGEIDL